jgi:integrase
MGNRSNRLIDSVRAQRPKRLPTILTKEEALRVTGFLSGTYQLITKLLYDSGLRLVECLRLRVKDVKATMIYIHALNRGGLAVRSPLD